jgi:hypothetical protein
MRGWLSLLAGGLLAAGSAHAHVASTGFLALEAHGRSLSGSVEIAVRDVESAIGADADRDGRISWGELRAAAPRLSLYLLQHLGVATAGGPCTLSFGGLEVSPRVDGNYAWLPLEASCPSDVRQLEIRYDVLQELDPSHRGLLRLAAGGRVQTAVLGGAAARLSLSPEASSTARALRQYFAAGTWHIWSGIDHLLFLLSLLLPAVLVRRDGRWEPVERGAVAFRDIVRVVTAFTLAHSLTLSLAAFDLVRLPSRLTESVIAASIIVAALNNLVPLVQGARGRIAFAFGLLHGFGFASVLAEMGLPEGLRLGALVAFNGGIEAGQLAVVAAVMPLAYLLRHRVLYRRALLPWGSAAIAVLAAAWLVQRALLSA